MDVDAFLTRDYELKAAYLTAHLGRMWTRFNFFVTLQSGLVAGLVFTRDGGGFTDAAVYFAAAEAVLSAIWWIFGAQDRYLRGVSRRGRGRVGTGEGPSAGSGPGCISATSRRD